MRPLTTFRHGLAAGVLLLGGGLGLALVTAAPTGAQYRDPDIVRHPLGKRHHVFVVNAVHTGTRHAEGARHR